MKIRWLFDGAEGAPAAPAAAPAAPAATPPAAAAPTSILDGGAPTADPTPAAAPAEGAWYAGLPADLASSTVVQKHREGGIEGVVRALMSAEGMLGRPTDSLLTVPDQTDKLDNLLPVMKKLGLPADASGYKLTAPEGVPETLGPGQPLSQALTEACHKAGVLPAQAQAIYAEMAGTIAKGLAAEEADDGASVEADRVALEKAWGPLDSDGAKVNIAKVNHVLKTLDPDGGLIKLFNEKGLGLNPTLCGALLKIEGFLSERPSSDSNIPFNTSGILGKDQALENARALLRKANSPDIDPGERLRLNAEAQRFYAMAESGSIASGQG